ncbi:glycosyltransferase [uncultured Polaribacter sp.]|uniref:glycosyltransferase n=1 Tax=uncultured Polaribacter sp. TaxID=174711 RepID=UPI002632AD69|nr:glycosyltransferase [uncultured Polaribacter sp.]
MTIHHVVSSIDLSSGGPARSVTGIINSILMNFPDVEIILETLETEKPIAKSLINSRGKIFFNKNTFLLFSLSMNSNLRKSKPNIFHGHGIWQMPVHNMVRVAKSTNIPYIITVRGMLESWSLEQHKLKKQIALNLFQYNDLKGAACIHATAEMEVESIRMLGFKNPIAMIPNGIEISDFPKDIPTKCKAPKKILFLSRIHKKKGLENLVEAWYNIDINIRKEWVIEIVGNGENDYIKEINELILIKNLEDSIVIKKPLFGKKKIDLYRKASLFVLPTFSENFGIVIAEALASYTPVITTRGTPWESLEVTKSGWWIQSGVEPLKKALLEGVSLNENEIITMGKNGRRLIEDEFSMSSVSSKMVDLYNWILRDRDKPAFIDTYE